MTSSLFNLVYLLTHTASSGFIKLVTGATTPKYNTIFIVVPEEIIVLIGQTVFENLVVRQIFWLSTHCGSGLHLGHKINFFLLYCCQEKRRISICWHVTMVQAFIWCTRL